jgi:hypothetical protein
MMNITGYPAIKIPNMLTVSRKCDVLFLCKQVQCHSAIFASCARLVRRYSVYMKAVYCSRRMKVIKIKT